MFCISNKWQAGGFCRSWGDWCQGVTRVTQATVSSLALSWPTHTFGNPQAGLGEVAAGQETEGGWQDTIVAGQLELTAEGCKWGTNSSLSLLTSVLTWSKTMQCSFIHACRCLIFLYKSSENSTKEITRCVNLYGQEGQEGSQQQTGVCRNLGRGMCGVGHAMTVAKQKESQQAEGVATGGWRPRDAKCEPAKVTVTVTAFFSNPLTRCLLLLPESF